MGSAVSKAEKNNGDKPKPQRPITPLRFIQIRVKAQEESQISISNVESGNPPGIVITAATPSKLNETEIAKIRTVLCYHSVDELNAKLVEVELKRESTVIMVVETGTLEFRESAIQWADVVVLMVSYKFQQNSNCQEITNYAKDTKKNVLMLAVQPNYDPTGVVGAVGKAYGEIIWLTKDGSLSNLVEKLKKFPIATRSDPILEPPKDTVQTLNLAQEKFVGNDKTVYISFAEGQSAIVAEIVRNGQGVATMPGGESSDSDTLSMKYYTVFMGVQNSLDDERIKACRVFVPVISKTYEASTILRQQFELARHYRKNILPVKAEKFSPTGWLSLAMAGKLFYEMKDIKEATAPNKNISRTSKMNDFIVSIMANLKNVTDECDREESLKKQLNQEIDEIKPKLKTWPPKDYVSEIKEDPPPDKTDLLPAEENKVPYNITHYNIFKAARPLYNGLGLPINETFDCMLSYQWDIQALVQYVYTELNYTNVKMWMDMQGGMLGNINDAMARAVEASVTMVVFLTKKYQQSVNCLFEIKYAMALHKQFIFIIAEDDFQPFEWIKSLMDKCLVLTIRSNSEAALCVIKNLPNIAILNDALRKLAEWKNKQRKPPTKDVSEEIYELQMLLENSKIALSEETGKLRFSICTRCGAQFEDDKKSGCKKHTTYYMGGNLLTGRWWCCQQTGMDSLGCELTDHIVQKRVFGEMENYPGCKRWTPA